MFKAGNIPNVLGHCLSKLFGNYWYGNTRFDAPYDASDMSFYISYAFLAVKSLKHLGSEKTPRHL